MNFPFGYIYVQYKTLASYAFRKYFSNFDENGGLELISFSKSPENIYLILLDSLRSWADIKGNFSHLPKTELQTKKSILFTPFPLSSVPGAGSPPSSPPSSSPSAAQDATK